MEILYIDDDVFFTMPYVAELQKNGFAVNLSQVVDASSLMQTTMDFDAIVLDIMMPAPPGVPRESTEDGQGTGLWFLGEFKSQIISRPLPVLVATNRDSQDVKAKVAALQFPTGLVEVYSKSEISKQILPLHIRRLINLWRRSQPRSRGIAGANVPPAA